jgi:hypothetical protein
MPNPFSSSVRFFNIGGVVYRSLLHTAHQGSVVGMIVASIPEDGTARPAPWEMLWDGQFDYVHSSNLPAARAEWLRRQIANSAISWSVSVDSDSEFDGGTFLRCLQQASDAAIVIVPMMIGGGGGRVNCSIGASRQSAGQMTKLFRASNKLNREVAITSGGFGVAAFNLEWFRSHWPDASAERHSADSVYGEDVEMCLAVGRRGGTITAVPVNSQHHDLIAADRSALNWSL